MPDHLRNFLVNIGQLTVHQAKLTSGFLKRRIELVQLFALSTYSRMVPASNCCTYLP